MVAKKKMTKGKFVRLTCKCNMKYPLGTYKDIDRKCISCRAEATNTNDEYERGRYQMSLEVLKGAVTSGHDYKKELAEAKAISAKVESPYKISIVVRK